MDLIEFFVQDFSRFYPVTILIVSLLIGDIYLFIVLLFGEQLNHIFKYQIVKPIMGNKKYPIIGIGKRPDGAIDCGLYRSSRKKKCPTTSYGMPSGHSQSALLFSTYNILNLIKNNNKNPLLYCINVFFALFIPWSRVNANVHTVQQTIVGGFLGMIFGYFFFDMKPKILKLIIK
jgi:membrane-associated phospholipid phosphatase